MTAPHQQHGDTEARLTGLDAKMADLFGWIQDNAQMIGMFGGGLLVIALIAVGIYESQKSAAEEAHTALMQVELDFARSMGVTPSQSNIPEPANPEVAQRAREASIGQLDALIEERAGSEAAIAATIRAAEHEVDLGRFESADSRLSGLAEELDKNDPRRGIALRLRAFTLEERGKYVEAGEAYQYASEVQAYPARALLFLNAAQNFERAGADERAITAYEQVLSVSPEVAEQVGVLTRMRVLEQRTSKSSAAPAAPPAAASEAD